MAVDLERHMAIERLTMASVGVVQHAINGMGGRVVERRPTCGGWNILSLPEASP